jgi:EAL domain-containing protein (putative c-di-GMP-specific phosphodiesterase class I)
MGGFSKDEAAQAIADLVLHSRLRIHYQPIVSLIDRHVIGYESLTRGPLDSPWHSPATLFRTAAEAGLLQPLECHVRQLAVMNFPWKSGGPLLFLNCHPIVSCDPEKPCCVGCAVQHIMMTRPQQLVVELPEVELLRSYPEIRDTVPTLQARGIAVALDDFGTGYAGLQTLVNLRPDWLKLDRSLITGIDRDPWLQEVVRHLASLGKALGIQIVAEGIETVAELETVRAIGIPFGQGFLLGLPSPNVPEAAQ